MSVAGVPTRKIKKALSEHGYVKIDAMTDTKYGKSRSQKACQFLFTTRK